MFLRILKKSLLKRKGKISIAILAVILGATIPAAMLTVSLDITEKVNYEFRQFGANLLIVPKSDVIDVGIGGVSFGSVTEQRYINETDILKIKSDGNKWKANVLGFAPFLYQVVNTEGKGREQQVVLVGTWFEKNTTLDDGSTFKTGVRRINGWWDIQGSWITDKNEINTSLEHIDRNSVNIQVIDSIIGITAAEILGINIGENLTIKYRERPDDIENERVMVLSVKGILSTGSSEDSQIFVSLLAAQNLTNRPNKVHTIQVSALCTACPIEDIAAEVEEEIPYVEAKSIKQLTSAEMGVLGKIEQMMLLVTIIALITTALGVGTTMTTSVIERQKEIGLMKSIGAENRKIAAQFFTEATLIGFVGGVVGFFFGLILAQIIGMSVFDSTISPRSEVMPVVLCISVAVTLIASALPVKRAMKIEPAIVLRGE